MIHIFQFAVGSIIAIAGIIVSIIIFHYERRRFRLTALMEAFRSLNDIRHKEARKIVYGNYPTRIFYEIMGLGRSIPIEKVMEISATIVRTDFNEIATLIRHEIIEESIFIEE